MILDEVDRTKRRPDPAGEGHPVADGRAAAGRGQGHRRSARGHAETPCVHCDDGDLIQLAADRCRDRGPGADRPAGPRGHRDAAARPPALPALPAIGGLEMAARYVPGTGKVGGDWYDVFPLPSGEMFVVIGDVAGTGLSGSGDHGPDSQRAAGVCAANSRPRRSAGSAGPEMRYWSPTRWRPCCARWSARPAIRHVSSAGHLPPILARPGKPAAVADVARNVLIGVGSQRRQVSILDFRRARCCACTPTGWSSAAISLSTKASPGLCAAVTTVDPEAAVRR